MGCSKLNAHLKELHVVESAACACGHDVEDANHYLLHCPLYVIDRNLFLVKINNIGTCNVNAPCIINGTLFENYEDNRLLFDALFKPQSQSNLWL